jgi:hypothetical protein
VGTRQSSSAGQWRPYTSDDKDRLKLSDEDLREWQIYQWRNAVSNHAYMIDQLVDDSVMVQYNRTERRRFSPAARQRVLSSWTHRSEDGVGSGAGPSGDGDRAGQ